MWDYTPRQALGFVWYAARRHKRESIEALVLQFNAARGDPKDIKKQVKEAAKE